jgi:hypothetical protein
MIHSLLRSLHNKKQAYPHVDLILIGGQSASKEMLEKLGGYLPEGAPTRNKPMLALKQRRRSPDVS